MTCFVQYVYVYIYDVGSLLNYLPMAWCECISLRVLCSCFIYSNEMFPATIPSALVILYVWVCRVKMSGSCGLIELCCDMIDPSYCVYNNCFVMFSPFSHGQ